jgi:hypothetical protein
MTKSLIIHYSEADESVLMSIFKKFKVKTMTPAPEHDYGDEGVPQRVADNILTGLALINKSERGEIVLQNAYDLLKELREEAAIA